MGSFSELYIADYPILELNNDYYHDIVDWIFQPSDFSEFERPLNQRNILSWGDSYRNQDGVETVRAFRSTAKICRERLELYGINYELAKSDFSIIMAENYTDDDFNPIIDERSDYSFYLSRIRKIIESKSKTPLYDDPNCFMDEELIANDFFVEDQSIILGLWSILYSVEPISIIEYNLTDIINNESIDNSPQNHIRIEEIIVLTEGKTDTEFIKTALHFFYPHLTDFYHFMDFESSKYEANASRLVHTIKSFIGSGIRSLIIALFDNDASAQSEISHLKNVSIPQNIKILQYPEIDWAKTYPTFGPTGIQHMDINGLACSIEMYLGRDCIIEKGDLIPVKWVEYKKAIDKYQGAIQNKEDIQKRFRNKAKNFNKSDFEIQDWKELISIIELIKNAWQ